MFSIVGVLMCVGHMAEPDMSRCRSFDDTVGPFESQVACIVRLKEIQSTWPPLFAQATGVPQVSMFYPSSTCKQPDGEPA